MMRPPSFVERGAVGGFPVPPWLAGRSRVDGFLLGAFLIAAVFALAPSSGPSSIDETRPVWAWIGPSPLAAQAPSGAGSGSPSREDPSALLQEASERYEDLNAFCAEFEQERVVPLLNQTTRSAGTLCQKRPGYFLMDFSDPDGDRVVADGESLWIYYPSIDEDQVIRTRLGGAQGTFDFHAEFLEDPTRRFDARYLGRETVTGRSTHVIVLEPRDPVAYEQATVWLEVDRGLIRKVEIAEENESLRRVVLSDIRLEPGLDVGRFSFEPPPGAQVLDRNLPSAPR